MEKHTQYTLTYPHVLANTNMHTYPHLPYLSCCHYTAMQPHKVHIHTRTCKICNKPAEEYQKVSEAEPLLLVAFWDVVSFEMHNIRDCTLLSCQLPVVPIKSPEIIPNLCHERLNSQQTVHSPSPNPISYLKGT